MDSDDRTHHLDLRADGRRTSPLFQSKTVEPYINLIYGWTATEKLTIAGSTGYTGVRQRSVPRSARAGRTPSSDTTNRWSLSFAADGSNHAFLRVVHLDAG